MSLPIGYKRLEYIESTGTQWIDTKVFPAETRILIDAFILEKNTGNDHHIASAAWAEPGKAELFNVMRLRADRTGYAVRYGNDNLRNIEHQGNVFGRHTFNRNFPASPYTAQVDSAETITLTPGVVGSIGCNLPLFAFRRNNGSCSGFTSMRLYSCKIWKTTAFEGVPLIRDFIPCKNASGEVGLWDDVNSVFYGNAGTGAFIAGEIPSATHKTLVNGTVYEVKGGKCMVGGTVYSIKKGRTLINGTGYDVLLEDGSPKLTWYFNDTVTMTRVFDVNFTSGDGPWTRISYNSVFGRYDMVYMHVANGSVMGSMTVYDGIDQNGWSGKEEYRTIIFDEEPTGDLLTWLQANATPQ